MIEPIAEKLERTLAASLSPDEKILFKLRGFFQEALVCTSSRVIILKAGVMTGHVLGTGMFQFPYHSLSGAEVNFSFLTGYFELSAGGMQNSEKSFWKTDPRVSPARAPNCVSIAGAQRAGLFRQACGFIMQKIAGAEQPAPSGEDSVATLERLARLRGSGIISAEEFERKKAEILARL